jgi:UDP-N-acetylmuramoyl-tripeptide--D-alanyl-D-alanine ligase
MAELGRASEELHEELGAAAAQAGVGLLVAAGKWSATTARMAKACARGGMETVCFADTGEACDKLGELVKEDDIVLVKGSRACGLERCVERLKELFGGRKAGAKSGV